MAARPSHNIDLTGSNAMDIGSEGVPDSQPEDDYSAGPSAPTSHLQQPSSEALHVLSYLTQRIVSCRSTAAQAMRLRPALAKGEQELTAALNSMVRDATSMSVLVLGDPGSGKTLLVERSIASVCAAHNTEGSTNRVVGVVRLSGILHLDERVAFMEIARQLCSSFNQEFSKTASFDENLTFLRNMLTTLHFNLKSVVFVLDGFERFARARGKQQLLYNLFDMLQHSKVQAAVLGLTCAQDVMESMEKRVRSRFSHRRIILTGFSHFEVQDAVAQAKPPLPAAGAPPGIRRPSAKDDDNRIITYEDTPLGVLQDILTLPKDEASVRDALAPPAPAAADKRAGAPGARAAAGAAAAAGPMPVSGGYIGLFNTGVATVMKDRRVKDALQRLFFQGIMPRTLMAIAHGALDAWHADVSAAASTGARVGLSAKHILDGIQTQMAETFVPQLRDLSLLQQLLVVGMVRLEGRKLSTYNFEMVWDECQAKLVSALRFTPDAAWRAFEELVESNIASWISAGAEAAGRPMRYAGVSLAVPRADVATVMKDAPEYIRRFFEAEA